MILSPNDEEEAFSKNHTQFGTKMVKIDTQFQSKPAKKTTPFVAPHTYIPSPPPPPPTRWSPNCVPSSYIVQ